MFATNVNSSGNYSQTWSKYNQAQAHEKHDFLMMLYQLCCGIDQPPQLKGRPSLPLRDVVFSIVYKIYSTSSSRRFMSDLADACRAGYISRLPHFNAFSNYLMNEEMAWLLTRLVEISSLPLAEHENEFAVDSTGLSTDRYARWVDEKEIVHQKREWHKLHIMCGRRSKIVTATVVTASNETDGQQLGNLLEITSRNFRTLQVAADGAYYSGANMLRVARVGGVPYFFIPSHSLPREGCLPSACNMVLYLYAKDRASFFKNYYKRNNVETAFSMIRACLGTNLRSTSKVAQYNEAICKVLCHNLRVLGRAMHEESVSPNFEPLAAYISRVEGASRALAEMIAGGRLTVPKRKQETPGDSLQRFAVNNKSEKPGGESPKPCDKVQVEDAGDTHSPELKKPTRRAARRARRHEGQFRLFED